MPCLTAVRGTPVPRHRSGLMTVKYWPGELPRKQLRLVQTWIELHRDELMADWDLAVAGENPYKIAPL
jgi:hypothetical protein